MAEKTVLIRADSSASIGIGHISRCMGLAQAFAYHGKEVVFVSKPLPGNINYLVQREGFQVLETPDDDIHFIESIAESIKPEWIVLDHPQTTLEYESKVRSATGAFVAVIDGQFRQHECDMLVNPNCYATVPNCVGTVPVGCRILAGYNYYILRDEFIERESSMIQDSTFHILVTLGGADPENATLAVCRALGSVDFGDLETTFDIVIGPANLHAAEIRSLIETENDNRFQLFEKPADLFDLIDGSRLCITAGGITMGEVIYLEKPVIGLVIADNQKRTIETLASKGAILQGDIAKIAEQVLNIVTDTLAQKHLVSKIKGLIDGKGKYRIVEDMDKVVKNRSTVNRRLD